jgi:hypothetical protein
MRFDRLVCIGVKFWIILQVSFHQFPDDEHLRAKWIKAIKRDVGPLFSIGRYTKVCSLHFKQADFYSGCASKRESNAKGRPKQISLGQASSFPSTPI